MEYSRLPDEQLLEHIVAQDTAALGALYDRYGRLVYTIAYRVIGEEHLAQEITQDVFLKVWEKAATYQSAAGKVTTWLTSIARYRSIDLYRQRAVRVESRQTRWDDLGGFEVHDPAPQVWEQAEQIQQAERVRRALGELPSEQRQVLVLAYFEGLSQSEIAARLDQPLGTVKTRVRLGMARLRQALEP